MTDELVLLFASCSLRFLTPPRAPLARIASRREERWTASLVCRREVCSASVGLSGSPKVFCADRQAAGEEERSDETADSEGGGGGGEGARDGEGARRGRKRPGPTEAGASAHGRGGAGETTSGRRREPPGTRRCDVPAGRDQTVRADSKSENRHLVCSRLT